VEQLVVVLVQVLRVVMVETEQTTFTFHTGRSQLFLQLLVREVVVIPVL
tara:strand:- start:453 stop:599 length:147 start_codon:yes stop_codon:yes gene_type:complete